MSKVVDNFLKYVAFDTQSAPDVSQVPSTEKQFALAKLLVEQMKAIGIKDAVNERARLRIWNDPGNGRGGLPGCRLPGSYGYFTGFFR